MEPLRSLLERFGGAGAVRNAALSVAARREEELLVEGLAERLGGTLRRVAQVA